MWESLPGCRPRGDLAIDPPVVAACAPGGIRIEVAELVGNASHLAIALVPHGPLGFEKALIRVEVLTGELRVEVFSILPDKRNKGLQDWVEILIAPRQGCAVPKSVSITPSV